MTFRLRRPPPPPPGRRLGAAALLLAAIQLLGACAALEFVSREPPRLYNLTPKSTFDDLPEVDSRLVVEVPTATGGLNTARIALRPMPTQLDYYAGAQWVDVVPVMVQNLLTESFDNTDAVDTLGVDSVGVRADYALLTHLREFQAEYPHGPGEPPRVNVRIQARLVRLPRRTQVASTSIQAVVPANGRSTEAVVIAFDEAFGRATKDLVAWALERIAAHQATSSAI